MRLIETLRTSIRTDETVTIVYHGVSVVAYQTRCGHFRVRTLILIREFQVKMSMCNALLRGKL
jgi:hypothetical protein